MAADAQREQWQPFATLNFVVEILPDGDSKPLAGAAKNSFMKKCEKEAGAAAPAASK